MFGKKKLLTDFIACLSFQITKHFQKALECRISLNGIIFWKTHVFWIKSINTFCNIMSYCYIHLPEWSMTLCQIPHGTTKYLNRAWSDSHMLHKKAKVFNFIRKRDPNGGAFVKLREKLQLFHVEYLLATYCTYFLEYHILVT